MKRPFLLYPICTWVWLMSPMYFTGPYRTVHSLIAGQTQASQIVVMGLQFAAIVVAISLGRLKPWAVSAAVCLMAFASVFILLVYTNLLRLEALPESGDPLTPRNYISFPIMIAGNMAAIWFLRRPRLKEIIEASGKNSNDEVMGDRIQPKETIETSDPFGGAKY